MKHGLASFYHKNPTKRVRQVQAVGYLSMVLNVVLIVTLLVVMIGG